MLKNVVRIITAVVMLMCGFSAAAQTAQFSGRVTDPQGAVVQKAEIRVVNQATGVERKMETNSSGFYTVPFLNPGAYQIFVQADGFTTTSSESITINVGQSLSFDVQLRLLTSQQQVEVGVTSVPIIDQTTSSLSTIETTQRIVDLPLNGRNFVQLAYLGAGANQGAQNNGALRGTTDNNRPGIQVAVNGLTSFDNNFLLDGVDNNEFGQGTLIIQPAPDAIQEFRVEENSMRAEFGRGGAAVNVLLKSGTNKFHGGVYEFIRNDKLDARNYFDPQRPPFQRNQFGGLLGGPILHNRTFFFVDYEGERIRQGVSYVSTVPTALMHTGDFSEVKANLYDPSTTNSVTSQRALLNPSNPFVIPANRIDSVGQAVLNVLPLPNMPGTVNNYVYTPKQVTNGDQFDLRIDHTIRQTDQLFGHAALQDIRFLKPAPLGTAGGCCQGFGSNINGLQQSYALGEYHAFNSHITNDVHIAFLRWQINTQHLDAGQDRSQALGIPNANRGDAYSSGLSLFNVTGYTAFGDSSYVPEIATDNTYQIADIVTWLEGRHAFKFGGDFRYLSRDFFQAQAPFGTFSFSGQYTQNITTGNGGSSIADLLLGIPVSKLQDNLASMDKTNMKELDAFFQDDWKITPGLTLNLGFRYDLYSPVGGRVGNFNLQTAIVQNSYGPNAVRNAGVAYDTADFGPRVGFAYAPQGSPGMVVHGAFGIFYSPEGNIFNDIGENPPLLELYSAAYNPAQLPQTAQLLRSGFPATLPAIDPLHPTGQVKTTGPKRLIPRIMEWNVGIEKQLAGNWVMSLAYVGTQGQRLWDNEASDLNQAPVPLDSNFGPAPNFGRPYYNVNPDLSDILTIDYPRFNLHFNGLEAKMQKKLSTSLTMLASYTWSKDIGTSHGTPAGSVQNSYNTNGERGYVEPDFRHRFSVSYTYQLPFGRGRKFGANMGRGADLALGGWELSGITVARTGEHETAFTSNDYTNTGSFGPRPDQLHNPSDFSYNLAGQAQLGCTPGKKTLNCWFNPTAFAIPALAPGQTFAHNFGNSYSGSVVGPPQLNFDLGLMKSFQIVKEQQLTFRAEVFNVANHAQFQIPNSVPDVAGGASISSTLPDNQREVQLSLKYMF